MIRMALIISVFSFLWSAQAQTEHNLVRRIAVFPLQAEKAYQVQAEEAWWQLREALTDSRRFLVASKNFLVQKDVYQSRADLSPADAIILGKLLDAHAIVTTFLTRRTLNMHVYDGDYGRLLWKHSFRLQPSIPIANQLAKASKKLILDFIASIPYQGFVIVDNLIGKSVFKDGNRSFVKVEIGLDAQIEVGDPVQWIRVYSQNFKPVFIDGGTTEVFAEGRVVAVNREIATVEILRASKLDEIKNLTLVRFPNEFKRIKDSFALSDKLKSNVDPEILTTEMSPVSEEVNEKRPLVTSVSWIVNLATFLLLAF